MDYTVLLAVCVALAGVVVYLDRNALKVRAEKAEAALAGELGKYEAEARAKYVAALGAFYAKVRSVLEVAKAEAVKADNSVLAEFPAGTLRPSAIVETLENELKALV